MDPARIADLDEDELDALVRAVQEVEREKAWGNLHEICATIAEGVWMLNGRLEAGVPVVTIKQSKEPAKPDRYPRPDWVRKQQADAEAKGDEDDVIVVHSVREALGVLKVLPGGKDGA
jgi:hypothetical protein